MTKDTDINQDLLIEGLIDEFYECGIMQVRDWLVGQNTGLTIQQVHESSLNELLRLFIKTSVALMSCS